MLQPSVSFRIGANCVHPCRDTAEEVSLRFDIAIIATDTNVSVAISLLRWGFPRC